MAIGFERVAPVLPVREMGRALEHHRRLGFAVEAYGNPDDGDPIYGFVRRGAIELHLARVPELQIDLNTSACSLYVTDADAVYAEWKTAAAAGRLRQPADTPYGLREFAYTDLDGNLLRVGSPLRLVPQRLPRS